MMPNPPKTTRRFKLKATIEFEVEVPSDDSYDPQFDLVENHCIGTGIAGAALNALVEKHEKAHTCWGCAIQVGEIEIREACDAD